MVNILQAFLDFAKFFVKLLDKNFANTTQEKCATTSLL